MTDPVKLDEADPLAFARERFKLPRNLIYLDGNSLGPLPAATPAALRKVVEQEWGADLIASWNKHGWIDWPQQIGVRLAPIVGAQPHELLIADSTSVSLFKLLTAALARRPERRTILTERGNFPTNRYVMDGLAKMLGLKVKALEPQELRNAIREEVALVSLTHVNYRSSAMHDMAAVNAAAHEAGALTLWDLSHSAGAVELDLSGDSADLAVGCGYKYLNGGPGAPAFVYIAEHLQDELQSPLQGWMGHSDPFAFADVYEPANGISSFQTGTPPIIALAALEAGLATFDGIDMRHIAAKSRSLSQLFIEEVERRCCNVVRLASPRDPSKRGSHIAFSHPQAFAIVQALIARGIIGDFRAPDLMRFGFAPLYNTHVEVAEAAESIANILATGEWDQPRFKERLRVT